MKENLEMESKHINIERSHRTGSKINGKKRARILSLTNTDKNNSGKTIHTLMRTIMSVQQN